MNQILHIFRKDTRQFWIEILISVLITAAFFTFFPLTWHPWRSDHPGAIPNVVSILAVLLILAWWLLTARIVFAETLVGDRQFWITRPYRWTNLLAAKALFLVVWIALPLCLAEWYLLGAAGISLFGGTPELLRVACVALCVLVVPLFAIASTTVNMVRLALTALAAFLAMLGFVNWIFFFRRQHYTPYVPQADPIAYPLLFAGCVAVLLVMYRWRRTWTARGLLLVLPFLLALVIALYQRQSLVDAAYPVPSAASAPALVITHVPSPSHPDEARSYEHYDYIDLPVSFSGVPEGYAVTTDDFRFTVRAPDGSTWTSPWQRYPERIRSSGQGGVLSLAISPNLYDRFKAAPVELSIELAVSRYQVDRSVTLPYPTGDTAIPGLGYCWPENHYHGGAAPPLRCRSAQTSPLVQTTDVWRSGSCDASDPGGETIEGHGWMVDPGPDFTLTAVHDHGILMQQPDDGVHSAHYWHFCSGSPLTITQYHLADRTRATLMIPGLQLPADVKPTGD